MSSSEVTLADNGDELRIEELVIRDKDVLDYLGENPTKEDVRRVLRIGSQALHTVETTGEVDLVDNRFQQFESSVEEQINTLRDEIDQTFIDDNAELKLALEDHISGIEAILSDRLGEDGEFLREALDHEDEESPLYAIQNEIRDLRDEVKKAQGGTEERKFSPRKGDDFEKNVERILQRDLTGPMDDLEATGTTAGSKGDSKKGDFLVTTSTEQVIAIEAKDRTTQLSKDAIGEYLTETLKNREADFAMMVMRNAEGVPTSKIGWFHEFDRQRLAIVLSNGPDEDIDWRFLKFGYNWARTRVAALQRTAETTDAEAIGDELQALKSQIDDFESIRNSAEDIRETASTIEDELDTLRTRLLSRIRTLHEELGIAQ